MINEIAHRQTQAFFELFEIDLPNDWYANLPHYKFQFEYWLVLFMVKVCDENISGFALLKEARIFAEDYYQNHLKKQEHSARYWAFYRFLLEKSLLRTCLATRSEIANFYVWHDALSYGAFQIQICIN